MAGLFRPNRRTFCCSRVHKGQSRQHQHKHLLKSLEKIDFCTKMPFRFAVILPSCGVEHTCAHMRTCASFKYTDALFHSNACEVQGGVAQPIQPSCTMKNMKRRLRNLISNAIRGIVGVSGQPVRSKVHSVSSFLVGQRANHNSSLLMFVCFCIREPHAHSK